MIATPSPTRRTATTGVDISSRGFWAKSFEERDETFAWLRQNAPISWHRPYEMPELPPELHGETGFWAVTRAEHVAFVSHNHELFSSQAGVSFKPFNPALATKSNFLTMDPPHHTRYRQIMAAAFTPKAVAKLSQTIHVRAAQIIDRLADGGTFDFVTEVASKLPALTLADLVGVPEELAETFSAAGDNFIAVHDPDVRPPGMSSVDFALEQLRVLRQIGVDIVRERRKRPADDIATVLAEADFDGRPLSDGEIESMMLLLSVAGTDTTKQTTSLSLVSLWRNPDQKAWLMENFPGRIAGSIQEFVRHSSPVIAFARTATRDLELGGQEIKQGEKVVMFYNSANRDESVFVDPHRFDLSRVSSPQYGFGFGFGGGGIHYCLGHGVSKLQLKALFHQILTRLPHMVVGEPEYLFSEFIHGIRHLPVRV